MANRKAGVNTCLRISIDNYLYAIEMAEEKEQAISRFLGDIINDHLRTLRKSKEKNEEEQTSLQSSQD